MYTLTLVHSCYNKFEKDCVANNNAVVITDKN